MFELNKRLINFFEKKKAFTFKVIPNLHCGGEGWSDKSTKLINSPQISFTIYFIISL